MAELSRRYFVMPMATEGPFDTSDPEATFVLKPRKDPAALRALETYRDNCYPELARDLDGWIRSIRQGPLVRGGVGGRNEPYLAARAKPAGAPARTPARVTAKVSPERSKPKLAARKAKKR